MSIQLHEALTRIQKPLVPMAAWSLDAIPQGSRIRTWAAAPEIFTLAPQALDLQGG